MNRKKDNTTKAFFALLRAGLWEKEVRLSPYGEIDIAGVLQLAEEQSVVGLVAAGIEHIVDLKLAKKDVLQFIGRTVQIEQRNQAMNYFIGVTVEKMREVGVYAVLLKGQGVAQCYARPQWRSAGDVDFFLDDANYEKAKDFLIPLANHIEDEYAFKKEIGLTIEPWLVELHGNMRTQLSRRVNAVVDATQKAVFEEGQVRIWQNDGVDVPLPSPDNDVVFVFTHFVNHFFIGGVGLRQICDWCRLLWTYRDSIDVKLLDSRLRQAGLMSEWLAFGTFAVEWLGMPVEAMPLINDDVSLDDNHEGRKLDKRLKKKAEWICRVVLDAGNFGYNKDMTYRSRYSKLVGNLITLWHRTGDFLRLTTIFPADAPRFFAYYLFRRADALL